MTRSRVTEAYARVYETPISARAGDHGQHVRRDDEVPGWVWVEHDRTGRSGWTPTAFLRHDDETSRVVFTSDYDAIELSVTAGEIVSTGETIAGWVWCQAVSGEAGWVPAENLTAMDDAR